MILVVGLSPAWQRILFFRKFIPGEVHRALRVTEIESGKAVNVTRVARQLGATVRLIGPPPRRLCQTIVAGQVVTELVEEAPPLPRAELTQIVRKFDRLQPRARLVVLSGSVPPGCGEDFYARLIRNCRVPVLLDTHARTKARPFLLKINRDECRPDCRAEWMVITDGSREVVARHGRERFVFRPPRVKPVNTIGSGDAMLAGIAVALERGERMPTAIRFGIACGAANALTELPGFLHPGDVKRLWRKVR
jgi:tagatose 6-phosphate kinase